MEAHVNAGVNKLSAEQMSIIQVQLQPALKAQKPLGVDSQMTAYPVPVIAGIQM
jgi:hypothetical protein